MKLLALRLSALLAILCAAGCGSRPKAALEDFTVPVYRPAYASGFEILGAEGLQSTILRTRTPWQGAEGEGTALCILRNGEETPADFDGEVLRGEAQRIVCMSSTHVALLDAVGAVRRIVGISGVDGVSNPYIAAHRKAIGEVGYEGNIDYERLLSLQPDLVLLFGVQGASSMEPKLRELGIPFVYMGEYLEESPLGKAEWLIAAGELTGCRAEAEKCFDSIPQRYDALRKRVAEAGSKAPKVMINTPYGDSWFMASRGSYVARLIADAGGDYIYRKNTSNRSLPIDLEEAYLLAAEADIWINVGDFTTLGEMKARMPRFAAVKSMQHGEVYNCDRRVNAAGGNDYWESGVVHPDLVLRDLTKIFHPELVADDFVYYRRVE
ncbi:ABC transporter substrate-binding protein [Alistipes sp.]|uniref:ABC transporter substrate-binding protein n=1 Tax=Alistipes sp. TaxID=1872444 RepID=UPI0025BD25F3|nr:ABC transporter substrate-binding protein [Alistipes sp.]MCI7140970.1 ABC transporter substrate-binding protein [Alistipes sp.]MDY5395942.1 ABC transporter substrate-binding protein [Alistipes sp.]